MNTIRSPRLLTHDERKAAEAAFAGLPCDPRWSDSAKRIYEGLVQAKWLSPNTQPKASGQETDHLRETEAGGSHTSLPTEEPLLERSSEPSTAETDTVTEPQPLDSASQVSAHHRQAMEPGWLIDVSEEARKLGLTFPVTITRSLWESGIAPSPLLEEEAARRLRDVLMAFRLRLVGHTTLAPLVYFPAMLAFPPEEVPQPILLSALIQADEQRRPLATLLLPHEVSLTVLSLN